MVTDDGMPPNGSSKTGSGIGLSNIRARLSKLYGEDYSFSLEPCGPGTRVSLSIPFNVQKKPAED